MWISGSCNSMNYSIMSVWKVLENIHELAATSIEWRLLLGTKFDAFKDAFLVKNNVVADTCPCSKCGYSHDIIRHTDVKIVAVAPSEPTCDDFLVKESDLYVYELSWPKLGNAITKAFGFLKCHAALEVSNTYQIASFDKNRVPVFLTIQNDRNQFKWVVSELTGRQQQPFILFAPTCDFIDGSSREILQRIRAKFYSLEETACFNTQNGLQPLANPSDLFKESIISEESDSESKVDMVLALLHKLDLQNPLREPPTRSEFFYLYCSQSWSIDKIVKNKKYTKTTVHNRKRACEKALEVKDLRIFRKYGDIIERRKKQYQDRRAKKINPYEAND